MTIELQRLLYHWPLVVSAAPEGWERDFARSIQGQSRRRNWQPSSKQIQIMRRMVDELFSQEEALVEE